MRIFLRALATCPLLAVAHAPVEPATAAPTDHAFNASTGAPDVDLASHPAKHDLVYNRANARDTRATVQSVVPELGLWDVSQPPDSGDVPDRDTWKTVSTYADATGVGLSRGQADPQGFGDTFAATVEGANHTAQVADGRKVRLTITPSRSHAAWFTASSRTNAPDRDPGTSADNVVTPVGRTLP